jgi:hypothetical protein
MPPLPAVPNVVKIVTTCSGNDGRLAVNVMHFTYSGGPPSSTDCFTIASNWFSLWVGNFIPLQPAQTSLVSVEVTDLSSDTGGQGTYDNMGVPVPGTSSHGMLPLHTCLLVSKYVAVRYRGGRPRSYLPVGTTFDLNDDGDWQSARLEVFEAAWATMLEGFVDTGSGSTLIVLECMVTYKSKNLNPTPPYEVIPPRVLTIPADGYTFDQQIATQRRRVRKTARHR